jgi:hypothetical protein
VVRSRKQAQVIEEALTRLLLAYTPRFARLRRKLLAFVSPNASGPAAIEADLGYISATILKTVSHAIDMQQSLS